MLKIASSHFFFDTPYMDKQTDRDVDVLVEGHWNGWKFLFHFFPIMTRCSLKLFNFLTNCNREMPMPASFHIFLVDYSISKNFQNRATKSRDIPTYLSPVESGCCKMSNHRHLRASNLCSSLRKTEDRQADRQRHRQTVRQSQTIRQRDIPTDRQTA